MCTLSSTSGLCTGQWKEPVLRRPVYCEQKYLIPVLLLLLLTRNYKPNSRNRSTSFYWAVRWWRHDCICTPAVVLAWPLSPTCRCQAGWVNMMCRSYICFGRFIHLVSSCDAILGKFLHQVYWFGRSSVPLIPPGMHHHHTATASEAVYLLVVVRGLLCSSLLLSSSSSVFKC